MEAKLLADSRKTTLPDEEVEYHNLDEHTFDLEIERLYLDKLKEQRIKIDSLTLEYRTLKEEMGQKEQLLEIQGRKLNNLAEQAAFKKKYEDTYRLLKQTEAQADRLAKELQQVREELALCMQEKSTAAKEMKSYLKETDFKLNEQLCVLREVIQEKQKVIDGLKHKQAEDAKKLAQDTFRRELNIQSYKESSSDRMKWMTDEIAELNRQIGIKDQNIRKLEAETDRWEKKAAELQQELNNKELEMQATNDEYKKLFQKMKFHIRSIKKQLIDREDQVARQKENALRAADSAKKADMRILDLSEQLRLQTKEHEQLMSRASFEWTQDRLNFQNTARDFRNNIDGLVKSKSQLAYENDKLHAVIKHKESTEKLRNSLSGNEHTEINRVERIMRRI